MSSQQFPRHGLPASSGGAPQIPAGGNLVSVNQPSNPSGNSLSLKAYGSILNIWRGRQLMRFNQNVFHQLVGMQTVAGTPTTGSRIIHLQEAGGP